jgi:hypothetical protein
MKFGAFLATAAVVATATLSASAQSTASPGAQPWLKDRRYGEGIGIRTGNLELHPAIGAELGYDSNYFQRADEEDPVATIRLRGTGALSLSTLGPQRRLDGGPAEPPKLNFRAGLFLTGNLLFPAEDVNDQDETNISDSKNVSTGVNFTLDILPQRPWGFDMYGDFVRTAEPSNTGSDDLAFDRDSLRLGAGINWRPGGGLFESRLGYELNYHFFESEAFQDFNNVQHYLKQRNRWRFLPRTALLSDAEIGFLSYTSGTDAQQSAQTVKTRIGINGLITHHFALLAMAGWAASFYEPSGPVPARNYDGPVGQAELKWFILPPPTIDPTQATVGLSSIALGYIRDYANSYLANFYRRDRVYGNFSYFIAGQFLVSLEGGYSRLTHGTSFFADGTVRSGSFGEDRVDATLFGEYRPSDIVGINTTLRYTASLNDELIPTQATAGATNDNLQFSRYEAWLGARVFW